MKKRNKKQNYSEYKYNDRRKDKIQSMQNSIERMQLQNLVENNKEDEAIEIIRERISRNKIRNNEVNLIIKLLSKDLIKNQNEIKEYYNTLIYKSGLERANDLKLKLAQVNLMLGKYDESHGLLNNLIINKKNDNLIKEKSALELGVLYKNENKYDKAIKTLRNIKKDELNYAKIELSKLYANQGNHEKAMGVLNECNLKEDFWVVKSRIYLLNQMGDYEQAFRLLGKLRTMITAENQQTIYNIMKELLVYNHLNKINFSNDTYSYNQMVNYSKDEALKHIENHLVKKRNKRIHSLFNDNVNIEDKFKEYTNRIDQLHPYDNENYDSYIIEEDDYIGVTGGILTKRVRILTNVNTNEIINAYPCLSHYSLRRNVFPNTGVNTKIKR